MNEQRRLAQGVTAKLDQWASEANIAAKIAKKGGRVAIYVRYPTGLIMARFAEPYSDYGMHYECTPEVWESL